MAGIQAGNHRLTTRLLITTPVNRVANMMQPSCIIFIAKPKVLCPTLVVGYWASGFALVSFRGCIAGLQYYKKFWKRR